MRRLINLWKLFCLCGVLLVASILYSSLFAGLLVSGGPSIGSSSNLEAASSSRIVVPDNLTSIQEAVDAASPGATVLVRNGTYHESVLITKTIHLIGEQGATIQEDTGSFPVIKLLSGHFSVVKGFRVKGFNQSSLVGIWIRYCSGVVLEDNNVTDCYYGVQVYDSVNLTFNNNHFSANRFNIFVWGLYLSHFVHSIDTSNTVNGKPIYYWVNHHSEAVPSDAGYVALINCSNILVSGLNLSSNYHGVLMTYTCNSTIIGMNLVGNEYGLHVLQSHRNFISNNTITNSRKGGIFVDSSRNNTIVGNEVSFDGYNGILLSWSPLLNFPCEDNNIQGNYVHGNSCGVRVEYSNRNEVVDNLILDNSKGLFLDSSAGVILLGNDVVNNGVGITIRDSSACRIWQNNFIDNDVQVGVEGYGPDSSNFWNDLYPVGGNFWSDYSGMDDNKDGIGDTAYVINPYNNDIYPLMGRTYSFNASLGFFVNVVSDSTVEDFFFFISNSTIKMVVSNAFLNQSSGFCRVCIPYMLMSGDITVFIDGEPPSYVDYVLSNNGTHRWVYFAYGQSEHTIVVLSEIQSSFVLFIFVSSALLIAAINKRIWKSSSKSQKCIVG